MAVSHVKSNTIGDFTGTVTVFNSAGSTVTANATDIVRPSDWNSGHNQFVTLSGNTNNSSNLSGTNIVFQGGNNITLSGVTAAGAATIVFSGANTVAQSNQSAIKALGVSNTGNTAGNTGVSTGVDWVFAASTGATLSESTVGGGPNTIWFQPKTDYQSSNANYLTSQSNQAFSASGGSSAFQTLNFNNANGFTFSNVAGAVQGSYTVPTQTNQQMTMFATGNTTQSSTNTTNASSIIFAGSGAASVGLSGGTVLVSVPNTVAQTNQTVSLLNFGNTTGQSSASTFDARTFNVSGAGIASVGWSSSSLIISVPAGGGGGDGFNIVSMMSSTSGGGTLGATFSALSASIGLMAGSNITLSQTSNTIVINGPAAGAGYTQTWFNPELYGNTITTTHANGTVYIRAFELDGAMDLDKYIFQQFISSQNSSTMSFSASVSAGNASSGTGSWGQSGTVLLFSRVNTNETHASYNSIQTSASQTYSMSAGYSASVSWSTNVSSATASWTTSGALGWLQNIDGAGGTTSSTSGTSGSSTFSSTSTNANSFSSSYIFSFPYAHLSGMRPIWVAGGGGNQSAQEYWIGVIQSTQTGSTNMSLQRPMLYASIGMLYFTASSNNSYLEYGNSAAISSSNWRLGFGSYSASSNTTAAIGLTAITSMSSNASMYFALDGHTH